MTMLTTTKTRAKTREFVVVPRAEYEEFSRWRKATKTSRPRVFKEFTPSAAELRDLKRAREDYKRGKYMTLDELKRNLGFRKAQSRRGRLDRGLTEALREVREGKLVGPFSNAKDLMRSLVARQ